jgi:putative SOS response-associated peptidase YedK
MCGRFSLVSVGQALKERFGLDDVPELKPRYNIAPSQETAIITNEEPGKVTLAKWGLVPNWAKEDMAHKMINARAESLAEKPAYRDSFKHRRCLVLADGFYEWKKVGNNKIPYRITTDGIFSMAGLWERKDKITFTIITTEPNDFMKDIHNRMPLVLEKK